MIEQLAEEHLDAIDAGDSADDPIASLPSAGKVAFDALVQENDELDAQLAAKKEARKRRGSGAGVGGGQAAAGLDWLSEAQSQQARLRGNVAAEEQRREHEFSRFHADLTVKNRRDLAKGRQPTLMRQISAVERQKAEEARKEEAAFNALAREDDAELRAIQARLEKLQAEAAASRARAATTACTSWQIAGRPARLANSRLLHTFANALPLSFPGHPQLGGGALVVAVGRRRQPVLRHVLTDVGVHRGACGPAAHGVARLVEDRVVLSDSILCTIAAEAAWFLSQ